MTASIADEGNGQGSADSAETRGKGAIASWVSSQLDDCVTRPVRINSLLLGDSPRCVETDIVHVRVLAESFERLPPILVHWPSRKVIDGAHRVRAASLRGESIVNAIIYEGSLADAFVLAVNLNSAHGLALSRAERMNAARRILESHPQWSDRMIAGISGLAPGTTRKLRNRSLDSEVPPVARIGKDGRVRPVDRSAGRLRARQLLTEEPNASARAIAKRAGISAATVLDVRRKISAGRDAVAPQCADTGGRSGAHHATRDVPRTPDSRVSADREADPRSILSSLVNDPSMRSSIGGRFLLRWMIMSRDGMSEGRHITDSVPDHCVAVVARLARGYAAAWREIAIELERRPERL
jgi:hypothetical protein